MTLPNNFQTRNQITYPIHHPSPDKTNSSAAKWTQMRANDKDRHVPVLILDNRFCASKVTYFGNR